MSWTTKERLVDDSALRYAALIYAVGTALHTADHIRRGSDVLTLTSRMLGGSLTVLAVVAIAFVLTRHRLAPIVAVAVAFPHAFWILAGHLVPRWNAFSDAFPGASAGSGVTVVSWATAVLELVGALAVGLAAARVLTGARSRDNRVSALG